MIKITDNDDNMDSTRESIAYLRNKVKMLENKVLVLESTVERLKGEKCTNNFNSNIYGKVYLNQYIKECSNNIPLKKSDVSNKLFQIKNRKKKVLDDYSKIKKNN